MNPYKTTRSLPSQISDRYLPSRSKVKHFDPTLHTVKNNKIPGFLWPNLPGTGIGYIIPGQGEVGKWHPGWEREIAEPLFTVHLLKVGQTKLSLEYSRWTLSYPTTYITCLTYWAPKFCPLHSAQHLSHLTVKKMAPSIKPKDTSDSRFRSKVAAKLLI